MIATDQRQQWKSLLRRLVNDQPGITQGDITKLTQCMKRPIRNELINELIFKDKEIRFERVKQARGRPKVCYWPLASVTQQEGPGSFEVTIRYPSHLEPPPSEQEQAWMLDAIRQSDAGRIDWRAVRAIVDAAARIS